MSEENAVQESAPPPEEGGGLPLGWTVRALVITAVIAAIFAVVNLGFSFLSRIVEVLAGPIGSFGLSGLYQIPTLLPFYVVGLPGAALFAGLIDGIVEVLLGNPYGAIVIVYALVQALGAEIGFGIWGWKSKSPVTFFVAGALGNVFGQTLTVILYGWASLVAANLWWVLIAVVSGGIFGLIAYGIGKMLENSGLLKISSRGD
jgi:energy-coupling factor transport system substrate-specific component